MKPSFLLSALIASTAAVAPVEGSLAQNATDAATVISRAIPSLAEPTSAQPLDTENPRDWGLTSEDWTRYRHLMQGPLGIMSPQLDPLTALGIEARSSAEREHYAALEAHMEGERVAKLLAYQRAYDGAWKRLYPTLAPVAFATTPTAGPEPPGSPESGRLAVFVKDPCTACDVRVRALLSQARPFDIYVVGLDSDSQIRSWAARVGIDPARVRTGAITLNHDEGRWLSMGGQGSLPAVLGQVNGQWQSE